MAILVPIRRSLFVVVLGILLGIALFSCAPSAPAPNTTGSLPASGSSLTTQDLPPTIAATGIAQRSVTAEITPARGSLVIQGTGDVNLDLSYIPALAVNGFDWAWTGLDGLFIEDDLTVVNLECSPSELGDPEDKDFTFRCAVDGLPAMAAAGVEVANLGNNHSQDFGKEAMLDGRANLLEAGVTPVGAGANKAEAAAPAIFEINGWKVAVLGFGGIVPNDSWVATSDGPGMAEGDSIDSMVETVEAASRVADWVIVAIHWGVELDTVPRPDDIERARALIAAGADAIFGHHPHRLQPFEMIDERPVAWSLGNFVWPAMSTAGSTTGVARVVISPDGEITGCLIPALIENSGRPVLTDEPECGPSS